MSEADLLNGCWMWKPRSVSQKKEQGALSKLASKVGGTSWKKRWVWTTSTALNYGPKMVKNPEQTIVFSRVVEVRPVDRHFMLKHNCPEYLAGCGWAMRTEDKDVLWAASTTHIRDRYIAFFKLAADVAKNGYEPDAVQALNDERLRLNINEAMKEDTQSLYGGTSTIFGEEDGDFEDEDERLDWWDDEDDGSATDVSGSRNRAMSHGSSGTRVTSTTDLHHSPDSRQSGVFPPVVSSPSEPMVPYQPRSSNLTTGGDGSESPRRYTGRKSSKLDQFDDSPSRYTGRSSRLDNNHTMRSAATQPRFGTSPDSPTTPSSPTTSATTTHMRRSASSMILSREQANSIVRSVQRDSPNAVVRERSMSVQALGGPASGSGSQRVSKADLFEDWEVVVSAEQHKIATEQLRKGGVSAYKNQDAFRKAESPAKKEPEPSPKKKEKPMGETRKMLMERRERLRQERSLQRAASKDTVDIEPSTPSIVEEPYDWASMYRPKAVKPLVAPLKSCMPAIGTFLCLPLTSFWAFEKQLEGIVKPDKDEGCVAVALGNRDGLVVKRSGMIDPSTYGRYVTLLNRASGLRIASDQKQSFILPPAEQSSSPIATGRRSASAGTSLNATPNLMASPMTTGRKRSSAISPSQSPVRGPMNPGEENNVAKSEQTGVTQNGTSASPSPRELDGTQNSASIAPFVATDEEAAALAMDSVQQPKKLPLCTMVIETNQGRTITVGPAFDYVLVAVNEDTGSSRR